MIVGCFRMELFDGLHTLYVSLEDKVDLLQNNSAHLVARGTLYEDSGENGLKILKQTLSDVRILKVTLIDCVPVFQCLSITFLILKAS
jgi:hypothetical protein